MLGFYLDSWGMFRASTYLLTKIVKHFKKIVNYISESDKDLWNIDVDNYNETSINKIINSFNILDQVLQINVRAKLTLITKVMFGVFGCIPAYDQYLTHAFRKIFDKNVDLGV